MTHPALMHYKKIIEQKIVENMPAFGPKNPLRDACEYVLTNDGKRFRPALVYMIADALGHKADVTQAALAIEYCHTASLVADDLPCMDDDDLRRNRPSAHKAFGEDMALLVSYALIAASYGCLEKNSRVIKDSDLPFAKRADSICVLALENASFNTGLFGATGGQFVDLYPPDLSLETIRDVLHKKTVSLFEISFVFGWLYGGGDPARLDDVKKAAGHFGMAFQIADDIDDLDQDIKNGRKVNMAAVFGLESAKNMVKEEIAGYNSTLKSLKIATPTLLSLCDGITLK
jgi:geranylgeranyl diphosphate synthase type II